MMHRVLVTGSRDWVDSHAVWAALDREWFLHQGGMTVVHGGARGVDQFAGDWARAMLFSGCRVRLEVFQAEWDRLGRAAGPIRNFQMVESGADVCLAFPKGESRGTRHCMATAARAGIRVMNLGS